MSGDIRESAAGKVGIVRVVLLGLGADVVVQVVLDCGVLVPGTREVVGETTGRRIPGCLGHDIGCSTDGSNVGAGGRENGVELGGD